jgi:hypothetical protein
MVGDFYGDKWKWVPTSQPFPTVTQPQVTIVSGVSREEFEQLRREVADMKELLIRAKRYDAENGEPDCELDEKIATLKRVADLVGVSLDDVFGSRP